LEEGAACPEYILAWNNDKAEWNVTVISKEPGGGFGESHRYAL
jgi:hypothetical protein